MVSFLFVGIEDSLLTSSHYNQCLVVKTHCTISNSLQILSSYFHDYYAEHLLNCITFVMQSMSVLRKKLDQRCNNGITLNIFIPCVSDIIVQA